MKIFIERSCHKMNVFLDVESEDRGFTLNIPKGLINKITAVPFQGHKVILLGIHM